MAHVSKITEKLAHDLRRQDEWGNTQRNMLEMADKIHGIRLSDRTLRRLKASGYDLQKYYAKCVKDGGKAKQNNVLPEITEKTAHFSIVYAVSFLAVLLIILAFFQATDL